MASKVIAGGGGYVPDIYGGNDAFLNTSPAILFIDDDLKTLQSLGNVLQSFGYSVHCAHDGADVVNLIKGNEFDLVLTDLKMKSIDGLEVLQTVKKHQPKTPVVIITGYASLLSALEAMHKGAYDYLVKPCNIKEMQLTIERGIAQKRLQNERDHYLLKLQEKNKELNDTMKELMVLHEQVLDNSRFKENMVSMFTHDIFNPLTSISGFLNVMKSDPEMLKHETYQQYFLIMQRNIKKIEFLANTFQMFSKIDSQNYEINLHETNVVSVVQETIKNVTVFGFDRNIQVGSAVPEGPIMIFGDPFELERALTNVFYNAIKYSYQNGVVESSLTVVRAHDLKNHPLLAAGKDYAVLVVKDYGIGMTKSSLGKIFTKFYRAPNAQKIKGSGVGLYITKFVIEQHNGHIDVQSSLGKGSQFTIYLPISDTHVADLKKEETGRS